MLFHEKNKYINHSFTLILATHSFTTIYNPAFKITVSVYIHGPLLNPTRVGLISCL